MNWRADMSTTLHSVLILTEGHDDPIKCSTDEYSAL
jgi:hypothetical protein